MLLAMLQHGRSQMVNKTTKEHIYTISFVPEYGKQGLVERGLLIMNQKWPRPHIQTHTHSFELCLSIAVYHLSTAVQVILITYKYKKYHSASIVLVYVRMSADTDTFYRSPEKLYVWNLFINFERQAIKRCNKIQQ